MRVIIYIVILGLLLIAPVERLDVAKLEPVQTVAVDVSDGMVVLMTDTGNMGQGKNIKSAVDDLEEKTPGVIYLDTAQYLLVTEGAKQYTRDLEGYLRSSVKVSLWDGEGDVEQAARFLSDSRNLFSLRRWNREM